MLRRREKDKDRIGSVGEFASRPRSTRTDGLEYCVEMVHDNEVMDTKTMKAFLIGKEKKESMREDVRGCNNDDDGGW